jgi:hypothetical protein
MSPDWFRYFRLIVRQMIANLYASVASSARYRNLDESCVNIGIITNGYRWEFVVCSFSPVLVIVNS